MALLLMAVELEILAEQDVADRDKVMREAAREYRSRGECHKARGQEVQARADQARAAGLEKEADKLAARVARKDTSKKASEGTPREPATPQDGKAREKGQPARLGEIQLVNDWSEPVTVVIDGVSIRLRAGEQRLVTKPVGPFTYEIPVAQYRATKTLEAGVRYLVRIRPR